MTRIRFFPVRSAILPKGTDRTAEANRYPVTIHPIKVALDPNSLPIWGIERFRALPVKVVRNAVIIATNKVYFCRVLFCSKGTSFLLQ